KSRGTDCRDTVATIELETFWCHFPIQTPFSTCSIMTSLPLPPHGEILLYQTDDGHARVECRFQDETLWLSQALIAELFDKDVRTINEHLQNIFEEGE